VSGRSFDPAAVDEARAALPGWDVQAEGITRTVTTAHPDATQPDVVQEVLQAPAHWLFMVQWLV
jgi:hypothetical protein